MTPSQPVINSNRKSTVQNQEQNKACSCLFENRRRQIPNEVKTVKTIKTCFCQVRASVEIFSAENFTIPWSKLFCPTRKACSQRSRKQFFKQHKCHSTFFSPQHSLIQLLTWMFLSKSLMRGLWRCFKIEILMCITDTMKKTLLIHVTVSVSALFVRTKVQVPC